MADGFPLWCTIPEEALDDGPATVELHVVDSEGARTVLAKGPIARGGVMKIGWDNSGGGADG